MIMTRKLYVLVFILVVVGGTTGIAVSATKKPATLTELALYKGADRQQILEEGAKKEGKFTFYTSGILTQGVRPVIDAFEKKYPFIKVDIWRAASVALLPRAIEEFKSGKNMLDVMEGPQNNMLVLQETGIAAPYYSPNFLQMEEESLIKAPGGGAYAAAFRSSGIGFGYNTKMLKKNQLPKTYQDLLDPKWKGKLGIVDTDTGINLVGCIYNNFGEDFLKKLAKQDFVVHSISGQAMLNLIANGEYPGSPSIYDSHVFGSKKSGAPVAWVALEPVRVSLGQIAVAKHAPHPHAALLFADFELSKESAEIHRGVGYDNFRKDVPALDQRYKKYFGQDTIKGLKDDADIFNRLFVNKGK